MHPRGVAKNPGSPSLESEAAAADEDDGGDGPLPSLMWWGGLRGARVWFWVEEMGFWEFKRDGFWFLGVWKWEFIKMSKEEGGGERESTCKGYTQMSRPWYGMRVGSTCLVLSIMN